MYNTDNITIKEFTEACKLASEKLVKPVKQLAQEYMKDKTELKPFIAEILIEKLKHN